jgi:hypothetical protein
MSGSNGALKRLAPTVIDARELMASTIREPNYAVAGILPEGLTILAGKPKTGKSWLALGTAIAVASGGRALGRIPVDRGDVLYLALEDTQRRLQQRLRAILRDEPCPQGLTLATTWPRCGEGGTEELLSWLDAHTATRLVIIDTLEKIRPRRARNGNMYSEDYEAISGLKRLADHAGAAFEVLHHTRKMGSDDPLETVSGTQGIGGAADAVLVLKRERAHRDATLFITGRDIEEREIGIRWDSATTTWTLRGESELSEERSAIIRALQIGREMTPKQIGEVVGGQYSSVKLLTWRMANEGQIISAGRGRYRTTDNSSNPSNSSNWDTGIPRDSVTGLPGFQGLAASNGHAVESQI